MLIAEDLLLLATDGVTGKTHDHAGQLDYALAGALLSDLELAGKIRLTTSKSREHRKNRVVAGDPSSFGDPLLDAVARSLTARDRTPADAVRILKKGLRKKLYQRLVGAGVLRQANQQLWRVFPVTRYPTIHTGTETDSRSAIIHHFLGAGDNDPRASALVACLAAAGAVPDVVTEIHPMLTKREIRRQARAYLDAHWPAKAAQSAYQADASAA